MKKSLLFFSLFVANFCYSQQKNYYTQPFPTVEISKTFLTQDKKIWYIGKRTGFDYNHTFVGCLDSNLQEIQFFNSSNLPKAEKATIAGLKLLDSTSLLLCINANLCDVAYQGGIIGILDLKSGGFEEFVSHKDGYNRIFQTEDGSFANLISKSPSSINIFDDQSFSFESIDLKLTNGETAEFAYGTSDQFYFFTSNGNFFSIAKDGSNKTLLGSFPLSTWYGYNQFQIIEKNKKIGFTLSNTLYLIDFQKNVIKKVDNSIAEGNFLCLKYFKEEKKLYVASRGEVQVFDDEFNLVSAQVLDDTLSTPNDIFKVNNTIYFAGKRTHTPQNIQEVYAYKSYRDVGVVSPLNKPIPSSDAALIAANFQNNPPIVLLTDTAPKLYSSDLGSVKITVKNTGNDTIRSFNLNTAHNTFSHTCDWENIFTWKFDNITIAPNQEKVVTLNQVKFTTLFENKNDGVCFWLSLVNGKPDANAKNDFICQPFSTIVIANDLTETNEHLSVFPNPSDGNLNISSSEEAISAITVSDAIGKDVFSQNIDNQYNLSLNLSFLPQGVYVLSVKKERTTSIVKVVIQD
jgi:hypothetical protein